MDPWRGEITSPLSLNRYVYALNNPVNYVDPTGLMAWRQVDDLILGMVSGAGHNLKETLKGLITSPLAVWEMGKAIKSGQLSWTEIANSMVQSIMEPVNYLRNNSRHVWQGNPIDTEVYQYGWYTGVLLETVAEDAILALLTAGAGAVAVKGIKVINKSAPKMAKILEDVASKAVKAAKRGPSAGKGAGKGGMDLQLFAEGAGSGVTKPNQVHHFASNKSSKYTSQFESITNKYRLDLDDVWNKELMPHQGRHPNAYHNWILEELQSIDNVAKGNKDVFLELFEGVKNTVKENPDMLRKVFWE
jgi:hypothetical protein